MTPINCGACHLLDPPRPIVFSARATLHVKGAKIHASLPMCATTNRKSFDLLLLQTIQTKAKPISTCLNLLNNNASHFGRNLLRISGKKINLQIWLPSVLLMLLPPALGFSYIIFGVIHGGGLRAVVYDLSWLGFAFIFVLFAIFSKVSMAHVAKGQPRLDLAVFFLFAGIWIYTTTIVAISPIMAYYTSGRVLTSILVGLSAAALMGRFGDKFAAAISWGLFTGMILHAPFLVWVYVAEGQNVDFNWLWSLPGYPNLRMYNHGVEAAIAAGAGLYFVTGTRDFWTKAVLTLGMIVLWVLLFWGGARGAFLALVTVFIFMATFFPGFFPKMWRFFLTTSAIGAGLSLLLPVPRAAFGILGRVNKTFTSETLNIATSGRIEIWSEAIDIFLERPWFGHGMVQYQRLVETLKTDTPEHVHNILLESLISFGLVGTLALIYLLGKILLLAILRIRTATSNTEVPMFFVAASLLAHGFVSGTYFHMHSMITIAIALGLLLKVQRTRTA